MIYRHLISILAVVTIAPALYAQSPIKAENELRELPDSLESSGAQPPTYTDYAPTTPQSPEEDLRMRRIYNSVMQAPPPGRTLTISRDDYSPTPVTPGMASLASWYSGAVTASGSRASMPGLMAIESGAVSFNQSLGIASLQVSALANKYAGYRFLHTQYGLSARLTLTITERISLTAFGSTFFDRRPRMAGGAPMMLNPAMAGYYNTSVIGGYADFAFDEHWGVKVGGQAQRQLHNGTFRAEPIINPYYKFNENFSIELPVGQILYHMLDSKFSGHSDRSFTPSVPSGGSDKWKFPGSQGSQPRNPERPRHF